MTTSMVGGGAGRTIALALGKTGLHVSVNGSDPRLFPVRGKLRAASLSAALDLFTSDSKATTVLVIGTRADGTPGWDRVDPDELTTATSHTVHFLSEAQALALEPHDKKSAAWVILATAKINGTVKGSARWWVQNSDGSVTRVDVEYLGDNSGQIYTLAGGNLADSPILVAGMVEALVARHPVTRVYVWSQDGLTGHWGYQQGGNSDDRATFWSSLRLPEAYLASGGEIIIVPVALDVLQVASRNGVPAAVKTVPNPTADNATGADTTKKE